MSRFRTIALTAFAGLMLVACGPAASGTESQGGGASQPASQAAQESPGGSEPSLPGGEVAELEALIPDTVGDLTLTKFSMRGNDFLLTPGSDAATIKFIQDLGVAPTDISMAFGLGSSADTGDLYVFVVRAAGADSSALVAAFTTAMNPDGSSAVEWSTVSLGGKQVQAATGDVGEIYVYAKGDTVFWVIASGQASAEEALRGLP